MCKNSPSFVKSFVWCALINAFVLKSASKPASFILDNPGIFFKKRSCYCQYQRLIMDWHTLTVIGSFSSTFCLRTLSLLM